jgi:hypothetical protein
MQEDEARQEVQERKMSGESRWHGLQQRDVSERSLYRAAASARMHDYAGLPEQYPWLQTALLLRKVLCFCELGLRLGF